MVRIRKVDCSLYEVNLIYEIFFPAGIIYLKIPGFSSTKESHLGASVSRKIP
jgi:hypothetical protein